MSNILAEIDALVAEFSGKTSKSGKGILPAIFARLSMPNRLEIPRDRMKEFCAALPPIEKEIIEGTPQQGLDPVIYKGMTVRVGNRLQVWRIAFSKRKS